MVCVAAACPSPRNRFLQLLPAILATARYSLRHLKGDALQDALAEVVAGSYVMFVALVRHNPAINTLQFCLVLLVAAIPVAMPTVAVSQRLAAVVTPTI